MRPGGDRFKDHACSVPQTLSRLLTPHPLQVHARGNQLQPLLVAMPDRKAFNAWWLSSARRAAPHAVRTRRNALLNLQVWKLPSKASIAAVLRPKLLDLFLTLLPVHFFQSIPPSWPLNL